MNEKPIINCEKKNQNNLIKITLQKNNEKICVLLKTIAMYYQKLLLTRDTGNSL